MRNDLDLRWFDLKKTLQDADKKELIDIIQNLYRLSEEKRGHLLAGSTETKTKPGVFEEYRQIKVALAHPAASNVVCSRHRSKFR